MAGNPGSFFADGLLCDLHQDLLPLPAVKACPATPAGGNPKADDTSSPGAGISVDIPIGALGSRNFSAALSVSEVRNQFSRPTAASPSAGTGGVATRVGSRVDSHL